MFEMDCTTWYEYDGLIFTQTRPKFRSMASSDVLVFWLLLFFPVSWAGRGLFGTLISTNRQNTGIFLPVSFHK